jgi:YD repeat-containing protein
MNLKILFCVLLFLFISITLFPQSDIKNITPVSPTAGSILKYGEQPVSLYSGIPNITIPIFEAMEKQVRLPISLSYHAGGNKVESIASSVGLGWTISGIPSITRSVQGIADESTGGFLSLFEGKTAKQLYEERTLSSIQEVRWRNYIRQVHSKELDSEPDIFYYNLIGKSGKFFYSQEEQRFITYPTRDIKILFDGIYFTIIDDDGAKYYFTDRELQSVSGSYQVSPTVSSWNITEIKDANNVDIVRFTYNTEQQNFRNVRSNKKYYWYAGPLYCLDSGSWPSEKNEVTTVSSASLRISSINFPSGQINFIPTVSQRQDLSGGYAIDKIEVKNFNGELTKLFQLNYKYLTSSSSGYPCAGIDLTDSKWLLLESLEEKSLTVSNEKLTHSFEYNESIVPPCRTTAAQDFWGFYNGKTGNLSLLPKMAIMFPGHSAPSQIGDGDRHIDPAYTQFCILKKIIYPTGGFSTFEYENNLVPESEQGVAYTYRQKGHGLGMPAEITTNTYTENFTINNPTDVFLNGNNVNGGSFLNIYSGGFGCSLLAGGNSCGNIKIRGTSPNNSGILITIYGNQPNNTYKNEGQYIPNGDYVMEASFNQDPINFQNFYLSVNWYERNASATPSGTKFGPGLRIKKITTGDGVTPQWIEKNYRYTSTLSGNITTGRLVADSRLNYIEDLIVNLRAAMETQSGTILCDAEAFYKQLVAYSSTPALTHTGSYVGYSKVYIQEKNNNEKGLIVTEFENIPDQFSAQFPYEPLPSNEHIRGLQKRQQIESKEGMLISMNENKYTEYTNNVKSFALKISSRHVDLYGPSRNPYPLIPESFVPYELLSTRAELTETDDYKYSSSSESIQQTTNNVFSNLHTRLIEKNYLTSKGETKKINFKYPSDLSDQRTVYQEMITRNILTPVIEEKQTNVTSNKELSKNITDYHLFQENVIIGPRLIQSSIKGNTLQTEFKVDLYDSRANILQHTNRDGIVTSFVWGYKQIYPIAKITGATYADVLMALSQSDQNLAYLQSLNEAALKAELDKLRNNLKNSKPTAQVFTYTYKPLIGMHTQTDPNGRTTYYEYDGFQRLQFIKDQDGNIVKKFCYNYAGQQIDCFGNNTAPNWQTIAGTSGCEPCAANNNFNAGNLRHQEKDNNPLSATYNQTRWVNDGLSINCPVEVWQNTATAIRCKKDALNQNTGEQEQEQKDINLCSPTYNLLRWVVIGTDVNACPLPPPCGGTCSGEGKKCIDNRCERGVRVYTGSTYIGGVQYCIYHYEFSDGSWSGDYYQLASGGQNCAIQ